MKKILVTGDRGYIGATLVPLLLKKPYEVVGYDTEFFNEGLGKQNNSSYKMITGDIRKISARELKGIDAIIHLAALSNDPMGDIDPKLTENINFKASVRLAKLAKKAGVKRFLFSSSCSIYGIAKEDTVTEKSKVNPLTAYAKSKVDTEKALRKLADSKFCVGLLRNSTVYGYSPKFRDDLVVNNFCVNAVATGIVRVMSDGSPWRPLIDVRDLSNIFITFLNAPSEKINGKIINIGFQENNFQVKQVLTLVNKAVSRSKVIYTGEHGADSRSYKVSFELFESLFPKIKQEWNLNKSIKDLVSQLKKFKFSKKDLNNKKYTRLAEIKRLVEDGRVDENLFWIEK